MVSVEGSETLAESTTTPEPSTAEAPAWSQWRDQAASTEPTAMAEPPAAEAPAEPRRGQQATLTEPTRGSLPEVLAHPDGHLDSLLSGRASIAVCH